MAIRTMDTTRRGFLAAGASVSALGALAVGARAQSREVVPLSAYRPKYLSGDEWAFVMAATSRLIPSSGDGAGALEARVPVFIDLQLAGDYGQATDLYMAGPHDAAANPLYGYQSPLTPAQIYRGGIRAFDDWCQQTKQARFSDLDAVGQDAALTSLEKGEVRLDPALRDFFTILLQNTKEGYFADPMYGGNHAMAGWVHIGFPGARASYLDWTDPKLDGVPYPLGPVSISGERA